MGAEGISAASWRSFFVLGLVLAILGFSQESATAFPIVEEIAGPQGFARRWEAGMPVGLFSQVNLLTGRVITTIPVTACGGRGPAVGFALFHNMTSEWTPMQPPIEDGFAAGSLGDANRDGSVDVADIDPFIDILESPTPSEGDIAVADLDKDQLVDEQDLGSLVNTLVVMGEPQWTHSYSAHLLIAYIGNANNNNIRSVTLVRDDGTQDLFTKSGSSYISPPGVFDTLTADATGGGFTLTSKSQWKAHFINHFGSLYDRELDWIADASLLPCTGQGCVPPPANKLTFGYVTSINSPAYKKLWVVVTANSGSHLRMLFLDYNTHGKLMQVDDIGSDSSSDFTTRHWKLLYTDTADPSALPSENGDGNFVALKDPMGYLIAVTYTQNWEIETIADKNGDAYSFAYNERGQLETVTDPHPFEEQVQQFNYGVATGEWQTTFTDRRGNDWLAAFSYPNGNLSHVEDPLGHARTIAYGESDPKLVHEATELTDPLSRTWSVDYDGAANVTSSTDPLGNKWTYTYSTDGKNKLLSVTPPGTTPGSSNTAKQVQLFYDDALCPMSITRIVEPAATTGGTPAETVLEYYHDEGYSLAYGKLKSVTPPYTSNPVVTEYEYDYYGQPKKLREGPPSGSALGGSIAAVTNTTSFSDSGLLASSCSGGASGTVPQDQGRDANGNILKVKCGGCKPAWLCGCSDSFEEDEAALTFRGACFPSTSTCELPFLEFEGPAHYSMPGCETNITRNHNGAVTKLIRCPADNYLILPNTRTYELTYDELGRVTKSTITSKEPTADIIPSYDPTFSRMSVYNPDWVAGTYAAIGPDDTQSLTTIDAAGRPEYVNRWASNWTELIHAQVQYDDAGQIQTVYYGNGAETDYGYDGAGRLELISHLFDNGYSMHELHYAWSADGLVNQISEYDENGQTAVTSFTYDNRNRLVVEHRTGQHPYHLSYSYDKAGNRLSKNNWNEGWAMQYTYDVSDPARYGSQGNRLVYSRKFWEESGEVTEENYYLYDAGGRVNYVVRKVKDDVDPLTGRQWYTATQIYYTSQELIYLAWELRWQWAEGEPTVDTTTLQYLAAMEYRYDSPRGRYRVQPRQANYDLGGNSHFLLPINEDATTGKWSDYAGDAIHGDFTVSVNGSTVTPTNTMAHEPGLAQTPWSGGAPSANDTPYLHGNLIGTTERMTDMSGAVTRRVVYTAFGEPIFEDGSGDTRYGYAGACGYADSPYTSGDPVADLGWLHVGARYYDPASGRFVQRDPLGIAGGANTYVYCNDNPLIFVDPNGTDFIGPPSLHWMVAKQRGWAQNLLDATDWMFPRGAQAEKDFVDEVGTGCAIVSGTAATIVTGGLVWEGIGL